MLLQTTAQGGLSRRRFLQTTAAAGAAAGLLGAPAKAQPKKGGTLRCAKGHGQTTDTLNPGTFENGFTIAMSYGMHGFLTGVAPDGTVAPSLAESWEATPDAKTWRFRIRRGVTFHSGKSLTLEDVVNSINFHRGEDSTSAAGPLVAGITEIRTEGEDTVVFELESGNADFPFTFTDYHLAICPADGDSIDWRSGDGCGPYRLIEFNPGVVARFERFADDWTDERGHFEVVEMLSIVDLNARTTALVSGDVQAIDKLDLKTVDLLARNPGVEISSVAGNQHYTFAMRCDRDPYTDLHVRQALKYAVNRQELVDKILFGYGTVGNDHPIGRGQRFFNSELEQTEYDPDQARFHLRQAGLTSLDVRLSAADAAFPGAVEAAVLYQNSARPGGVEIDVNRVPNDGYWSDVWMNHPFCAVYWGGRPTEDAMFTTAYKSGAAWNDTFWSNERFDELLLEARAELDEERRRDMYWDMQAILNRDGGAVIPMFANYVFATTDGVAHGDFSSHWDMDGERWMERWWFA
ncbi:MAG: ABC transporter substrate-binding protein [Pseudomonadota bacterium]